MKNSYEVRGNIVVLFIKHKEKVLETYFDLNDLEKVKQFPNTWCIAKQRNMYYTYGWLNAGSGKQTTVKLHRHILDVNDGFVDHINRNGLDNRRVNLRIVTNSENMQNVSAYKTSKSGIRGVSWSKSRHKWKARVVVNQKEVFCKFYNDLKEAEDAIKKARKKYMPYSPEGTLQ